MENRPESVLLSIQLPRFRLKMSVKKYQPFLGVVRESGASVQYAASSYPRSSYRNYYARRRMGISKPRWSFYRPGRRTLSTLRKATPKAELKFIEDVNISGGIGENPAALSRFNLAPLVKGTNYYNRIGDSVTIKDVNLQFEMQGVFTSHNHQRLWWAVVVVRDPYNIDPWSSPSDFVQPTNVFLPNRNPQYINSFKVLRHGIAEVDDNGPRRTTVQQFIPVNMVARYSGNAGTYADDTANGLWFVCWADNAANPPLLVGGTWRTRFYDN